MLAEPVFPGYETGKYLPHSNILRVKKGEVAMTQYE